MCLRATGGMKSSPFAPLLVSTPAHFSVSLHCWVAGVEGPASTGSKSSLLFSPGNCIQGYWSGGLGWLPCDGFCPLPAPDPLWKCPPHSESPRACSQTSPSALLWNWLEPGSTSMFGPLFRRLGEVFCGVRPSICSFIHSLILTGASKGCSGPAAGIQQR